MKNNFWGREINCIELSVYHNLIAVASHSHHLIYLWNYEYGKLVASINLEDKYPTCLHFINGFSMLLVGTVDGTLLAYKFNLINLDI
jgi:WD40 repeat protein